MLKENKRVVIQQIKDSKMATLLRDRRAMLIKKDSASLSHQGIIRACVFITFLGKVSPSAINRMKSAAYANLINLVLLMECLNLLFDKHDVDFNCCCC